MEITMYEDRYSNSLSRENVAQMKRKFTLDLNSRNTKRPFMQNQHVGFNALLTSPDLKLLKLASPELDQLVLQGGGLSPSGFNFPIPKQPNPTTISEEEFVKGFQDSLEQLHNKNKPEVLIPTSTEAPVPTSASQLQYTQLEVQPSTQHQVPVTTCGDDSSSLYIKEEPQTVPSGTPPLSPINMKNQEIIKLERKRLRNRIAASKCRRRKLERISKLEDKVEILKGENTELQAIVNRMRDEVCSLKQEVMDHVASGCEIAFLSGQ